MKVLLDIQKGPLEPCPYIKGETACNEFFLAENLSKEELETFFSKGWRKFGPTFFRPVCPQCTKCTPLRIDAQNFKPSNSQKRILKKNNDLTIQFNVLEFREEIFQLYKDHSYSRFNQTVNLNEFLLTHYYPSALGFQSEYYLEDKLIAVGFLDVTSLALNSVYFIYNPIYLKRNLGIYSIIKEIQFAKSQGLDFYYLGYHVKENPSLNYKAQFRPLEYFDWEKKDWFNF